MSAMEKCILLSSADNCVEALGQYSRGPLVGLLRMSLGESVSMAPRRTPKPAGRYERLKRESFKIQMELE